MLIRALIVVLAIFNAGVTLWWLSRPAVSDAPVPAMSPPEGVPVLQLRAEVPLVEPVLTADAGADAGTSVADAPAVAAKPQPAAEVAPVAASAQPAAAVCVSLGTFADRAQLDAARARAGSTLEQVRARELAAAAAASYRVMLPPAASRQAAQETVKRIVAAGISDYFIIGQGEQANAIALGQFRNRDGAQRRLDKLLAAGFPAQIQPSTPAAARWWLDARLADGVTAARARQATGAERVQSLDCAKLR